MLLFAAITEVPLRPVTIYVAPNGSDSASGRSARAALKTLTAARDAARKLPATQPVRIQLAGGTYRLTEPLTLGPEDSGAPGAPREWTVARGAEAIVTGAVPIGPVKAAGGVWRVAVPEGLAPMQLFVNGEQRTRARLPKVGVYRIDDALPPTEAVKDRGHDRFTFTGSDLKPEWAGNPDVQLTVFLSWTIVRSPLAAVDPATRAVTLGTPTPTKDFWGVLPKGNRYFVENAPEALGEPGFYTFSSKTRELAYVPQAGETPGTARLEVPNLPWLLEIKGDAAARKWVQQLTFRGIRFEGASWPDAASGRAFYQAEADMPGAVRLSGVRDVRVEGCEVRRTGGWAIEVGGACRQVSVVGNRLYDLGAGGVKVGEMAFVRDPELQTAEVTIENNAMFGGGRIHPAGVGVWIGQNPRCVVRRNTIDDFYYSGVSAGWSWGYQESGSRDNVIEDNRITRIGQGVLSDMGGIYTLSPSPGTILRGNRIEDVNSYSYGGWGLYTDEGSTNILLEDNIVLRTKSAGFHQHYGRDNVIRNNVFAFGREAQVMRTRVEDHLSFTFERNVVVWENAPLLGSNWGGNNYRLDRNVYWRTDGKAIDFAGMTLEQWRAKGQDVNSVFGDPGFVDFARGDLRLKPGAAARKVGFRPITRKVGASLPVGQVPPTFLFSAVGEK